MIGYVTLLIAWTKTPGAAFVSGLVFAACSAALFVFGDIPSRGATLTVPDNIHEFGDVPAGTVVSHRFSLVNREKRSVTIVGLATECSCTVPHLSRRSIPPGTEAALDVSVTVGPRPGLIRQSVDLRYVADGDQCVKIARVTVAVNAVKTTGF